MHNDSFDSNSADDPRTEGGTEDLANGSDRRRRRTVVSIRLLVTLALGAVCVLGARLAHVSVSGTAAALVDSVSTVNSDTSSGSAADTVYCGSGSAIGLKGWAPSFRWHYGFPGGVGADDGWSASVQPTCPSGSLSIVFHDDTLSLKPGSTFYGGYDFHAANDPAFTLTTYSPTIVFSPIACANGSTPTQSSLTFTMTNGSYYSPANTPDWIPTGDKTSLLGFQGKLTMPDVCNGANVLISGGTFTTTIKVG